MDDRHRMSHRCATCQYSTHNFARYKQHVSLDYQDIKGYSYRRPSIFYPHKTARFPLDAIRLENNDPKNSVRYTCDQCNYSCFAKHSLTKHKNSCHSAIKSSPVKKRLSKPPNFPLLLLIYNGRRNSQALSRKTTEQTQKRSLSSSSSSSCSSNNSKAEGFTVPRKTP